MKRILITSVAIGVVALGATKSNAQTLNYGAMQDMFGEPVTTSANGSPMRASDAPLNMTIISAEDIARYPAREIPDILRHYAGVSVRQNTAQDYTVGIRGFNQPGAERLLVLVNGRQVYDDAYGLVNWAAIPVEIGEIRQIEIVRGPNTALFGFNATSGVINIVTYNPLYDDIDYVEADIGINQYKKGAGVYTFQNEGIWGARISYSNQSIDEPTNTYSKTETFLRDDDTAKTFNADVAMQINENTQMRFETSKAIIRQNMLSPYYQGTKLDNEFSAIKAALSSDTDYGIIEATLYNNKVESSYQVSLGTFDFNNDIIVAQLSDTFKIGTDHTFRLAGEFRNNETLIGTSGTESLNIQSLSSLWYWDINDALAFSAAARYDHVQADYDGTIFTALGNPYSNADYSNRYDEFGYNLGLVYKMTDIDTFRLTAAKGVDLPSPFELSFQNPVGTIKTFNNPTMDVSDVHDFQIGYERYLAPLNGAFKLSTFYQRINEIQAFELQTPTLRITDNVGDSEAYGFDVSLDGKTDDNIRWGLNYSFTRVDDKIDNKIGTDSGTDYEDLVSESMINAHLGYSPNQMWDYDFFLSYQSDFDANRDDNDVDSVFNVNPDVIFDTRIAYKPTENLTLSLNGQALFGDNEQLSYGKETDTQVFMRIKYGF